jgi:hypothetical protein
LAEPNGSGDTGIEMTCEKIYDEDSNSLTAMGLLMLIHYRIKKPDCQTFTETEWANTL